MKSATTKFTSPEYFKRFHTAAQNNNLIYAKVKIQFIKHNLTLIQPAYFHSMQHLQLDKTPAA